jgi:hypothetical protein
VPTQVKIQGIERRKAALAMTFLVFSGFPCGLAQSAARSVVGIVSDREGSPLPSCVVQIEDTATLGIRSYITGNDGAYHFMDLDPDRDYMMRALCRNTWGRAKTLSRFDSRKQAVINLKVEVLREE